MQKLNCWEFKRCGREPGGIKVNEMGVCRAALEVKLQGVHNGRNAGRACWIVAGTLCGGKPQGTFAHKVMSCIECEFYRKVRAEEEKNFLLSKDLLGKLK